MGMLYYLMLCFGDRFINCSKDEAQFDFNYNRENMVGAYNAILDYVHMLADND